MCCFGCCCSSDSHHDLVASKGTRRCTDVGFLIIFLLFCTGLGITTWYALSRGDPYRIMYGSDSFGNTCGRQNSLLMLNSDKGELTEFELSGKNMLNKKYMFPMNNTNPLDTIWNCVAECPQEAIATQADLSQYQHKKNNSLCVDMESSNKSFCPVLPVYKSTSLVSRCIPENLIALGQELAQKVVQMDFVRGYLSEIVVAAPFILKMSLIALLLSVISVFILRFFASVLIYFIYLLVVVVFIAISGSLWYSVYLISFDTKNSTVKTTSFDDSHQMASLIRLKESSIDSWLRMDNTSQMTAVGLAIGASLITIFVFFVVWCLLPRGQKMVKLFKEASKALAAMPLLLLQPFATSVCVIIVAMYTLSTCFLLYTAGDSTPKPKILSDGMSITVIETEVTETTRIMFYMQLVGFVWLSEFVLSCQRLFIAGSISLWYFDSHRKGAGRSAMCDSMCNTIRYHLGSAALGSFIITLVRLPRYILMYIYAKMKAIENPIARRLLACFIFTLACIERCLNYINYNAYTVISYSGISFCPAAKTAVNTLLDNAIDVAALNTVGAAVLYLTKFIVAAITATIAAYQITTLSLNHPWLPVVLVFVCAYLIANCFLSVYEMTLDTLLLCCAEDADMASEHPEGQHQNEEFEELMTLSRATGRKNRINNGQEMAPLNQ